MFALAHDQMTEREEAAERLKAESQMVWIQEMNGIYRRAEEVVWKDLIET